MRAARGAIVNLVDIYVDRPLPRHPVYCMAKAALAMMTLALARELGPEVRVNAVAPGMIETDMSSFVRGAAGDQIIKAIPMKRIGKPAEIASVVAFLAGADAAYLTGQVLRVDGGLSLGGY